MRLHRVAPLAWAGLLLNCSVAAILQFAPHLHIEAYSLFTTANVKSFLPFIQGAIAAQAAAVMLLWLRVPGAIAIAFVSGAVLLPCSLIFIEGCLMTRQRGLYAGFEPAFNAPEEYGLLYANTTPEINPHLGLGVILTGILFYMLAVVNIIGSFLVVIGVILTVRSRRLRTRPAFGLYNQYFVFTPNIWAETYAIPYRQVRAYLLRNKRINLVVADAAGQEHELFIALKKIHAEDRDDAVSTFASKLALGTQLFGG